MHYASGTTFLFGVIFLALIEIRNLCKTFGTGSTAVHALEDVSLDIEAGEIFGIIGLSGAGKSTLVRCMNLLERPTSGTVTVDGADMTALSEKELRAARREIGMIFQSFNLLMQRNALANVRFPLELAGVPKKEANKRAQELLDMVGSLSRPALRRPEAARRHRPRPRHQPKGPALRRGHKRPRPHDHREHP